MAVTANSVKVVKTFPFKGGSRVWSNRYHFIGGTPSSDAHWHTLFDNIVAAEKLVLASFVTITECIGYIAPSDVPVSSKTYATAGTVTPASGFQETAGEVAALVRYSTNARSTKNHPIYCFNYYHGVFTASSGGVADLLDANQKADLATYAAAWIAGFSDGALTYTRSSPASHAAVGSVVEEYVTHRDFPYSRSL